MKIVLPKDVHDIIETLQAAGYPAYVVGGCVRDSMRGKDPADWDIATAAPPEKTLCLFPKTVPTGLQHGTVTVLLGRQAYEVTTLRVDGAYEDHRRPDQVTYTQDIIEDLSRRDFTMNAMAYHPQEGLVDPFGGQEDIREGIIRCVGDPLVRFDEDALRMLRTIRFAAQTGFVIDESILSAICACGELIRAVSAERIRDELIKTLLSAHPEKLEVMHKTGLLAFILPELDRCFLETQHSKYHCHDVGHHSLEVVRHTPPELSLRLAALLHDVGRPNKKTKDADTAEYFVGHELESVALSEQILTRLRVDNRTKDAVLHLIRHHDKKIAETKTSVRRAMSCVGAEIFPKLLLLMRANSMGQHPEVWEEAKRHYDAVEALMEQILTEKDALTVSELAISGHDLLALGFRGTDIGVLLKQALALVLEHPEYNQKSFLLEYLKK